MIKRPFLIFVAVVGASIAASIFFIQSSFFARTVKSIVAQHIPSDLGIEGDFSEFAVKFFPPGISVRDPRITVQKSKLVDLPKGSTIHAERIDLTFLPLQMLTGNIRVNEATIVRGTVRVHFDREYMESRESAAAQTAQKKARPKTMKLGLSWDELLKVRIENIGLEETRVHLSAADPSVELDVLASELRVGQWTTRGGGLGYEIALKLSEFKGRFPKGWTAPEEIEQLEARVRLNAQGAQLDRLVLQHQGVKLEASGGIKGNLLKPKALPAELKIKAEADVKSLLALFGIEKEQGRSGTLKFSGDVRGELDRPLETLKAKGLLSGKELNWDRWYAATLDVEGEWAAAQGGGDVDIVRIQASAPERERLGNHTPASGGKLEVGAFKYRIGSREPIVVPAKLERAHLHWLLAPSAAGVFGVMLRATGDVQAKFAPPTPKSDDWNLEAKLDLKVEQFQLDNQRIGKQRGLKRVLKVPAIGLKGGVIVDSRSFRPDGLVISMPNTQFTAGGQVDFKKGLDLKFTGPVKLDDIGEISEKQIRGHGTITTRVVGPGAKMKLIFDADLREAQYLRLNFGDFRGRIIWDDEPEHLNFEDVKVTHGRTVIVGGGKLDLSREGTIDMDLPITQGTTQDLLRIFDELIKNVSWVPRGMTGSTSGRVKISGGLDLEKLKVVASMVGTNWDYLGERVRQISFTGGYDSGKYFIDRLDGIKRTGSFSGRITYEENRESLTWILASEGMTLADFDHIASLDVPLRGNIAINSRGSGTLGKTVALDMTTVAVLDDLRVRGVAMPKSDLLLKSAGTKLEIQGTVLNGQGTLEAKYDFRLGVPSSIKAKLSGLDFSPMLLLLNSRLIQDRALAGKASGQIELNFLSGEIERSSGRVELSEYLLSKTGTRFELAAPVSARIEKGTFDLGPVEIKGSQGSARMMLEGRQAELNGKITGDVDVSIAEFITPSLLRCEGTADLDFVIGGTVKEPKIFGKASFEDVGLQVRAVDAPFENVSGALQLRQNVISAQNIEANLANGRVTAGGTISLFVDRVPKLDLHSNLRDVKLKVFPFQFVRFRGKLKVAGDELPYLVNGEIVADSGLAKEKMMTAQQGARALKAARFQPKPVVPGEGDYPLFKLDIGVEAEKGILVQNDVFDAELKADVRIVNTMEAPRVIGKVDLLQGRIRFREHLFQIQSAEMEFDSPAAINPRFNLLAATEINQTKIQLYSTGRLENYKIEMTSNPPLPEQEIVQLLAMGATSSDIGRLRPADRNVVETGGAASLVLHSLDVNRDLQQKTGFQLQIDDAVNTTVGTSIFQPRSESSVTAAPKVVIRRQAGRFGFSMGSTVGVGTTVQREFNAEFRLSRGASLMGVWNSFDNGGGTQNSQSSSLGLDLRLQKRFK